MDEANTEGTSQPSVAPAPSELPESPVASSSSHENSQAGQSEQGTEQDETHEGNSSYKASEIAGRFIQVIDPKSHVDTAVPIDSVKGAVSKFGGILDWRERRKEIQDELDKVQVEVAKYQKLSEEAEAGKARALLELDSSARAADEQLRQSLEKAQTADAQARQDTELAELRLRELQRGASESAAAKAEVDAVRDRRDAAFAEVQSARSELASLEKERAAAAAAAREAAKAVAGLGAELVALKRELESSHAAHGEAEEKGMALAAAFEQDKARWQGELEEGEVEAKRLREELMAACDVEIKAESAAEMLTNLKAELLGVDGTEKARKEVKESIDRAKGEAYHLRFAAASMRDDLEKLAKAGRQTEQRRQALLAATEEAEFAKLSAERELRQWRADHDHHHRTGLAEISALDDPAQGNPHILSPRGGYMAPRPDAAMVTAAEADANKQRKTLFPTRMVMFLARKKAQTWK